MKDDHDSTNPSRLDYDSVNVGDILIQSTDKRPHQRSWHEPEEVVRYIVLQKCRCTTAEKDWLKTWILWIDQEHFGTPGYGAGTIHYIGRDDLQDWYFDRLEL